MKRLPLVRYYDYGWRWGYLVEEGPKQSTIQQIMPYGTQPTKRGQFRETITVDNTDLRKEQ